MNKRKLRIKLTSILMMVVLSLAAYLTFPMARFITDDSILTLSNHFNQFISIDSFTRPSSKKKEKISLTSQQRYWNYYFPADINEERIETNNSQTWVRPTASVYIDIQNKPFLNEATQRAMQNWNRTNTFKFKMAKNKSNANIVVRAIRDSKTKAIGSTSTAFNPITGHLLRANIALNLYYLQNSSTNPKDLYRLRLNTAEHELGHAIGLKHANNVSVMYPFGSRYSIQVQDIQAVRSLYPRN